MSGAGSTDAKAARAGIALSLATFSVALASGLQALLYLNTFGVDGRTDGLFVALALYATFGIFGQSIRVTAAPLLVGRRARLSPSELACLMGLIAIPVAVATIVFADPLADLLAPGLAPDDRAVTAAALPPFGAAMILQLWASGGATLLAVRDRFVAIARAYMLGAATGVTVFLAVHDAAGELTLAWSMLGMAAVTCVAILIPAIRSRPVAAERAATALDLRGIPGKCALVLGRTVVYLVFNSLFVITIAFVSRAAPGDATVLSYAFMFASYLVAGTGFALGMGRIADMRRATINAHAQRLADTVVPGYRYSMLLVAPALAGLVAFGAPLIGDILPASFDPAAVAALREFTALLALWTVAALIVNLLLPAMFALGKARLVNALAPFLLVLHLVATWAGEEAFGAYGAIGAFFVAPAVFAVVLAVAGAGMREAAELGRELLGETIRFGGLAAVAFSAAALLAAAVESPWLAAAICAVTGTGLYAVALAATGAPELRTLGATILRRRRASAAPGAAIGPAAALDHQPS